MNRATYEVSDAPDASFRSVNEVSSEPLLSLYSSVC